MRNDGLKDVSKDFWSVDDLKGCISLKKQYFSLGRGDSVFVITATQPSQYFLGHYVFLRALWVLPFFEGWLFKLASQKLNLFLLSN